MRVLRVAFLSKLPRLSDLYFSSRLPSDMAERSHSIHRIGLLPSFAAGVVGNAWQLLLSAVAATLEFVGVELGSAQTNFYSQGVPVCKSKNDTR